MLNIIPAARGYPWVPSLGPVAKFATFVGTGADVQKSCTFSYARRHIIYEGAVALLVESISKHKVGLVRSESLHKDVRHFQERAMPGPLRAYLTGHRQSHVHAYLRTYARIQTANPCAARFRRHLKFHLAFCTHGADHPDGSCAPLHAHAVRI